MKNSDNKSIALYGGSFDPPHNGHELVIRAVLEEPSVEELWIIPSSDSRYDKKPFASFEKRLEMLKILIADVFSNNTRLKLLDIEKTEQKLAHSYAIETVEYLKSLHPEKEFSWIIGSDNVATLKDWKRSERLFEIVKFLVINRPGQTLVDKHMKLLPNLFYVQTKTTSKASSSEIRTKIKLGESVFSLVNSKVLSYISSSNLY